MRQEKQFGFPRFKKVGRYRSFVFPQFKSNPITGWQIKLPKIGKMPIVLHRAIPDGFVVMPRDMASGKIILNRGVAAVEGLAVKLGVEEESVDSQ